MPSCYYPTAANEQAGSFTRTTGNIGCAGESKPPQYIEMAQKMAEEICSFNPSEAAQMVETIKSKVRGAWEVKANQIADEIDHASKRIEEMKQLSTKL